jgi:DNA-binding CsgD family transcriptional regulator
MSRSTVNRVMNELFEKFGVSSSNALIAEATRRGLH